MSMIAEFEMVQKNSRILIVIGGKKMVVQDNQLAVPIAPVVQ